MRPSVALLRRKNELCPVGLSDGVFADRRDGIDMLKRILAALLALCLVLPALAEETPYRQRVTRADEMIFEGPGYDEFCVGTVREAGVYTIVEEVQDGEGHLWGRLKSGAGWLDLTHVRSAQVAAQPVSAAFAEQCMPAGGFHGYAMAEDDAMTWLAFRAYQPLSNVRLVNLVLTEEGFAVGESLHTLPEMTPETPLLAGVVFWGDMTTYGLLFTDEAGQERFFAAYISGRNGMLILEERMMR